MGTLDIEKSEQSEQTLTDFYGYLQVGYELSENVIFSVHILASGSYVRILHLADFGC